MEGNIINDEIQYLAEAISKQRDGETACFVLVCFFFFNAYSKMQGEGDKLGEV